MNVGFFFVVLGCQILKIRFRSRAQVFVVEFNARERGRNVTKMFRRSGISSDFRRGGGSRGTAKLTDALEQRPGKRHHGGDGAHGGDALGVPHQHDVGQPERDAVDQFDGQYPNRVGYDRIQVKPDGEREQAQRHAVPVANALDDVAGEEHERHLAADALDPDGQPLQRLYPRPFFGLVRRSHVLHVPTNRNAPPSTTTRPVDRGRSRGAGGRSAIFDEREISA